jgi:hypothetical protein
MPLHAAPSHAMPRKRSPFYCAQYFLRKLLALGWLPYARRPSLPFFMLAPRAMSTRGGVGKPKDLATLTRSRLLMLKTLRKL